MKRLSAVVSSILLFPPLAWTADFAVKKEAKAVPDAVAAEIRDSLNPESVQILSGEETVLELWFRKSVPLKSKPESPAKALDSVAQATLLGIVSVPADRRDYRDDSLPEGVYTVRFALQPQDGDHSGTSDFPYFAVLIPIGDDKTVDGITGYRQLVDASRKETSSEHPVILSLRPVAEPKAELPALTEPVTDHRCVQVQTHAAAGDAAGDSQILTFELVFEGLGDF
jgi:hypothetical protein